MPIFAAKQKPLMTAMVAAHTVEQARSIMTNAIWNGAEAFYIQLELLQQEDRCFEKLHSLFEGAEGHPILITAYRGGPVNMSEEERAELLLLGLESGANVCDVMGDLYAPVLHQLTEEAEALEKQAALISHIHQQGGKVLISTHLPEYVSPEKVLKIAVEQERRGADILKIVNQCNTESELQGNLEAIFALKSGVHKPFLLLTSGRTGRFLRLAGPALGVCMYLTVDQFTCLDFPQQPKLTKAAILRDILFT